MKNVYLFCETAKNRLIMFVNAFFTFQKDWKQQLFFVAYDDFVGSVATG